MDMDSRRLVGMLPDREANTFADWLRAHRGDLAGTEGACANPRELHQTGAFAPVA